jgi:hypothetical protein
MQSDLWNSPARCSRRVSVVVILIAEELEGGGGRMVQFRKSKKIGPFRVGVSQRGISTSVGAGPFRISKGADGKVRRTIRIPGTGIYDTRVVGGQSARPAPMAHEQRAKSTRSPQPGWYTDPTGQSDRRYWDGNQWTSAVDPLSPVLRAHQCPDGADERQTAIAVLRGWRLVTTYMKEDTAAAQRIIAELDGCTTCLVVTINFLAGASAGAFLRLADDDRAQGIAMAEQQLAQFILAAEQV